MTQRDWIEKDFYRELGVASGAASGVRTSPVTGSIRRRSRTTTRSGSSP